MTAPWSGSRCDKCGILAGFDILMAPNGWQYCRACAPTQDAEQAVREARQKARSSVTFSDTGVVTFMPNEDALDALIAAVRAATLADVERVVEGMTRCVLENGAYVDLPDLHDAIDITGPTDILFKRDVLAAIRAMREATPR